MVKFIQRDAALRMITGSGYLLATVLLSCGLVAQTRGQSAEHKHEHNPAPTRGTVSRSSRQEGAAPKLAPATASVGRLIEIDEVKALIPDARVFNQSGEHVHLYSDLIKGKVVLLSFFYTDCTYICNLQGEDFSKLQDELGARLGKEVFLISISMNPAGDTPQKLGSWAKAFGIKPGWTLVSGNTPEINKMIEDFTGNRPGPKEIHSSVVFLGNDRTGEWAATDGLGGTKGLVKLLDRLARNTAAKSAN
jgi:protein SCO1